MRRTSPLFALVLAACAGAHPAITPVANQGGAAGGCLAADRIVIAFWIDSGTYGDGERTNPAAWHVFLDNQADAAFDEPAYRALAPAATAALAGGATHVRLYPPGHPPCDATITGGFELDRSEGPRSRQHGLIVTGCPAPGPEDANLVYGQRGDEDSASCHLSAPVEVASRFGDDHGSVWKPAAASTPIPADLAARLPLQTCQPPTCEPLWLVQRTPDGAAASVLRTALRPDPQVGVCELPHDDDIQVLVRTADGLAPIAWPKDSYARSLDGVLSDDRGPRFALISDVGRYDVYELGAGGARRARTVRWYENNEEDSRYYSLAPYCGP